ncbi:hypothetical protein HED51_12665 [Ochrobactrum grignonense]|nr:hypothetical protein [Brucella grignonensis]
MTSAIVEKNLKFIAGELINKGEYYEPLYDNEMPYEEQIISIFEYIDHGEYGVAYENLICLLEIKDLRFSKSNCENNRGFVTFRFQDRKARRSYI